MSLDCGSYFGEKKQMTIEIWTSVHALPINAKAMHPSRWEICLRPAQVSNLILFFS